MSECSSTDWYRMETMSYSILNTRRDQTTGGNVPNNVNTTAQSGSDPVLTANQRAALHTQPRRLPTHGRTRISPPRHFPARTMSVGDLYDPQFLWGHSLLPEDLERSTHLRDHVRSDESDSGSDSYYNETPQYPNSYRSVSSQHSVLTNANAYEELLALFNTSGAIEPATSSMGRRSTFGSAIPDTSYYDISKLPSHPRNLAQRDSMSVAPIPHPITRSANVSWDSLPAIANVRIRRGVVEKEPSVQYDDEDGEDPAYQYVMNKVRTLVVMVQGSEEPARQRPPPLDPRALFIRTPELYPLASFCSGSEDPSNKANNSNKSSTIVGTKGFYEMDEILYLNYLSGQCASRSESLDILRKQFLSAHNTALILSNTSRCTALAEDCVSTMVTTTFEKSSQMGSEIINEMTISAFALLEGGGCVVNLLPCTSLETQPEALRLSANPISGVGVGNYPAVAVESVAQATYLSRALVQNARSMRTDPFVDEGAMMCVRLILKQRRLVNMNASSTFTSSSSINVDNGTGVYLSSMMILYVGRSVRTLRRIIETKPVAVWPLFERALGGQCMTVSATFIDKADQITASCKALENAQYLHGFANYTPCSGSVQKFLQRTADTAKKDLRGGITMNDIRGDALKLLNNPQRPLPMYGIPSGGRCATTPANADSVILLPLNAPTQKQSQVSVASTITVSVARPKYHAMLEQVKEASSLHTVLIPYKKQARPAEPEPPAAVTQLNILMPEFVRAGELGRGSVDTNADADTESMWTPDDLAELMPQFFGDFTDSAPRTPTPATIQGPLHTKFSGAALSDKAGLKAAAPPPLSLPPPPPVAAPPDQPKDNSLAARLQQSAEKGAAINDGDAHKDADDTQVSTCVLLIAAGKETKKKRRKKKNINDEAVAMRLMASNTAIVEAVDDTHVSLTLPYGNERGPLVRCRFEIDEVRAAASITDSAQLAQTFSSLQRLQECFIDAKCSVALLACDCAANIRSFSSQPVWTIFANALRDLVDARDARQEVVPSQITVFGSLLCRNQLIHDLSSSLKPVQPGEVILGTSPLLGTVLYNTRGISVGDSRDVDSILRTMLEYADMDAGQNPYMYVVFKCVYKQILCLQVDSEEEFRYDAIFSSYTVVCLRNNLRLYQDAIANNPFEYPTQLVGETIGGPFKTAHLLTIDRDGTSSQLATEALLLYHKLPGTPNHPMRPKPVSAFVQECLAVMEEMKAYLKENEAHISPEHVQDCAMLTQKYQLMAQQHYVFLRDPNFNGFVIYPNDYQVSTEKPTPPTVPTQPEKVSGGDDDDEKDAGPPAGRDITAPLVSEEDSSELGPPQRRVGNDINDNSGTLPPMSNSNITAPGDRTEANVADLLEEKLAHFVKSKGRAERRREEPPAVATHSSPSEHFPCAPPAVLPPLPLTTPVEEKQTTKIPKPPPRPSTQQRGATPLQAKPVSANQGTTARSMLVLAPNPERGGGSLQNGKSSQLGINSSDAKRIVIGENEFQFDEVLELQENRRGGSGSGDDVDISAIQSFHDSSIIKDGIVNFLAASNTSLIIQQSSSAECAQVVHGLLTYTMHSCFSKRPSGAECFFSASFVDDEGKSIDLLSPETLSSLANLQLPARTPLEVGTSPLTGPTITSSTMVLQNSVSQVIAALASALRADQLLSAVGREHLLVMSLCQKLVVESEEDVVASSLLIIIGCRGPLAISKFFRHPSTATRSLLDYTLTGNCFSTCCSVVSSADITKIGSISDRKNVLAMLSFHQKVLCTVRGRPTMYNSFSDLLSFHRRLEKKLLTELESLDPAADAFSAQMLQGSVEHVRYMIRIEEQVLSQRGIRGMMPPVYGRPGM